MKTFQQMQVRRHRQRSKGRQDFLALRPCLFSSCSEAPSFLSVAPRSWPSRLCARRATCRLNPPPFHRCSPPFAACSPPFHRHSPPFTAFPFHRCSPPFTAFHRRSPPFTAVHRLSHPLTAFSPPFTAVHRGSAVQTRLEDLAYDYRQLSRVVTGAGSRRHDCHPAAPPPSPFTQ